MVDGVHFRTAQLRWPEIGQRALAAALSDLAAMAAAPGEAYLALGVPSGTGAGEVAALARGAAELAAEHGTAIVGGDLSAAPVLMVSVTVVGWVSEAGEVIGRDGAQVGDRVCLTGALGGSGAGLAVLDGRAGAGLDDHVAGTLCERFARPPPPLCGWPSSGRARRPGDDRSLRRPRLRRGADRAAQRRSPRALPRRAAPGRGRAGGRARARGRAGAVRGHGRRGL